MLTTRAEYQTKIALSPQNFSLREQFGINLDEEARDKLDVILHVPLSPDYPAEMRAIEELRKQGPHKGDILDLKYRVVDLDFAKQKISLGNQLKDMYATTAGKLMLENRLQSLNLPLLQEAFVPLVEQGRFIFNKLFQGIDVSSEIDEKIAREALESALSHPQIFNINTPPSLRPFPWSFLFNDPAYKVGSPETIELRSFWGFKHEIQEEFIFTSSKLCLRAEPELVASVCSVTDTENWHNGADHPFTRIGKRLIAKPLVTELGAALKDFQWDCLYFFGHASHDRDNPEPTTSYLKLRHTQLTVAIMQQDYLPQFKRKLVVAFLNGCETAPLSRWSKDTVVGFLCERGNFKLCCISSVAELPPAFAARFAKHFWERFLIARQTIGQALLNARNAIFNELNNPLALSYSLFGRVDTRIEEPEELQQGSASLEAPDITEPPLMH